MAEVVHGMPPSCDVAFSAAQHDDSVRGEDVDEHLFVAFEPKFVYVALVVLLNRIKSGDRKFHGPMNGRDLPFGTDA